MNKKGFTLIELLATISILALMTLIIGVNITSILRSTQKNEEDFDKEQISKAACVYADSDSANTNNKCKNTTGSCTAITVMDLYNAGLLDKNYQNKTGTITVTRTNGEKKCEYSE